ncbi:MAG: RpoL/Rpb11 RNA polymerase subunit family protein [Candidatus Aenigmarchaeota archaeon]|nr:RpoL/Rpb11 RNA polymerase subunit family protein [Candidatus Aenigmarchaeota archaeon]
MELRVIKKDEKELLLETRGETVTLTNLLRDELWNRSNVIEAAQIKEHPYLAEPKIFLKVSSGSPQKTLELVAKKLGKRARQFKELFKAAVK